VTTEPAPTGSSGVGPPPDAPAAASRGPDLALARTHLRLGSLALARTELETLAGRGTLDDEGIRDLAEARWRTGDVLGAGEAAAAWLERHPNDILGLVVAAEAQAALGRPAEARRLAGRAMERADGSLDPVFAGMQRSAIWPTEPGLGAGPVGVLFDDLHPGPHAVEPIAMTRPAWSRTDLGPDDDELATRAVTAGPAYGDGPSLWGDEPVVPTAANDALDPTTLFHRARVALERGDAGDAATGLILALRSSPGLAPAVLDLLATRSEPILSLVRGDAQRIVGRDPEALRDHASAAGALPSDPAEAAPPESTSDLTLDSNPLDQEDS
jgi:hypothetical protein